MKPTVSLALLLLLVGPAVAVAQRAPATSNLKVFVAPSGNCAGGYWGAGGPPVSMCGDDAKGDGSQSAPWATPQHAIDVLYSKYDFLNTYAPTIQLASAPAPRRFYYPGMQLSGRLLGQPGTLAPLVLSADHPTYPIGKYNPFTIKGDPTNPSGAVINPGAGGRPPIIGLSLTEGAAVKVTGLSFDTTHAAQDNIDVFLGSFLDLSHVVLGNAGNELRHIQIGVAWGSTLEVTGPITVAGNASSFLEMGAASVAYWNNNGDPKTPMKIDIVGEPQFSNGFINATKGAIWIANVHFNGKIKGTSAVAKFNGVIDTGTGNGTINGPLDLQAKLFSARYAAGQCSGQRSLPMRGAIQNAVGIRRGAISGNMKISFQAARSMG